MTEQDKNRDYNYGSYLKMTRSDAYTELHRYYTQDTYLDVLGVARQENPHSSFIRWLLDPQSNHSLGEKPFRRLIEAVCLTKDSWYAGCDSLLCDEHNEKHLIAQRNIFHADNQKYLDALRYGRYEIDFFSALTEKQLSNTRRADIFLDLKITFTDNDSDSQSDNAPAKKLGSRRLILVIENKVHSQEHSQQTSAYAKLLLSDESKLLSAQKEEPLVMLVFLTPYTDSEIKNAISTGNEKKVLPGSRQFITVNYQTLLDSVLEPCLPYCEDDRSRVRLSEYIRCLGQARTTDEKDNADYLVMAVSRREAELARQLYDESQDAVKSVMDSMYNGSTKFLLNESERGFWMALANVYEYLFNKPEYSSKAFQEDEQFRNAVVKTKSQSRKRIYWYKGEKYESFTSRNLGMLGHDIIRDVISQQQGAFDVDGFRRMCSFSSWLRQVIITEDEVRALPQEKQYWDKNYKRSIPIGPDGKKDYSCSCIEDFTCSFFSYLSKEYTSLSRKKKLDFYASDIKFDASTYDDLACTYTAKDGTKKKLYVAKFWTGADINALVNLIQKKYRIPITLSETM